MRKSPLLSAIPAMGLCLGLLAVLVWQVFEANGTFTYSLDDAYIHLALAEQWAETGILGVNEGEFAAASSSPLFTLLLTVAHLMGGRALSFWTPLALNVLASLGLLWWLADRLREQRRGPLAVAGWSLGLVLFAALPAISMLGMEHLLHAWALVQVLDRVARGPESRRDWLALAGWLALLGSVRYEGLAAAVLLVAAGWLHQRDRRWWLMALAASLPLLLWSLFCYANSGMWLPGSVAMKLDPPKGTAFAGLTGIRKLFKKTVYLLTESPVLLPALLTAAAGWLGFAGQTGPHRRWAWLAAGLVGLHLLGSSYESFRYEAYLLVLLFCLAALGGPDWLAAQRHLDSGIRGLARLGMLALLATLLWMNAVYNRSFIPLSHAVLASRNIHDQQGMMAAFVNEYGGSGRFAVHDLGQLAYQTNAYLLDLEGLGSPEVTRLHRDGRYSWASLRGLMDEKEIPAAILYATPYEEVGLTLEDRVASWHIEDSYILGWGTVSFFAWTEEEKANLTAALRAFESRLPARVQVEYFPTP